MSKVKNLKQQKHILAILFNLSILLQLFFVVMVVLFSLYMFLQLMNNHALDFLTPFVNFAKGFIHLFFGNSIKASKAELDGELAAVIILNIILSFVLSQLKTVFKRQDEELDKKIVEEKIKEEQEFNQKLEVELKKSVSAYGNYTIGFTLKAYPLIAEALQIYGEEKLDVEAIQAEATRKFFEVVNGMSGLKTTKEGDILLISSSKFESVDLVLSTIYDTIERLKKEYKDQKVIIKTRLAIETYKSNTSSKKVYMTIKALLDLNSGSDVLCYGNFNNRYSMLKSPKFSVIVKGKYDIDNNEQTIWALVKKF